MSSTEQLNPVDGSGGTSNNIEENSGEKSQISSKINSSTQDSKVIELLNLYDEYEKLTNGDYRDNFINGYLDLSRANFNSSGRRFGSDSFDMKPYKSCKQIVIESDNFSMIDLLQKTKKTNKESKKEGTKKEDENANKSNENEPNKGTKSESETIDLSSEDVPEKIDLVEVKESIDQVNEHKQERELKEDTISQAVQESNESNGTRDEVNGEIKNRKNRNSSKLRTGAEQSISIATGSSLGAKETSIEELGLEKLSLQNLGLRDPLLQFGGLVPYQLSLAQAFFEKGLVNVIEIINMQSRIKQLIREINELETDHQVEKLS